MRKLALDIGDVRIGLAISDMLGIIANPLETYTRVELEKDLKYISALAKERECDTIVIGLPVNMDGSKGERVRIVQEFGVALSTYTNAKIVYEDERLTTVSAERFLLEADMRRDKRKKVIDKVAASIILRSYLDRIK